MMKIFVLIFVLTGYLYADEVGILTDTREKIIQLKKKQIIEQEKINKYQWLSDIYLNASIKKDEDNLMYEDYSLSFSQDIFKFGGIGSEIQYAKELRKLENINLDISTKEDIYSVYSLLIDLKINELNLKQNILNVKNRQIDIAHKTSQYKAGEIGISDLNDAIILKNNLMVLQESIVALKQKNLLSLKQFTSKKYSEMDLPHVELLNKELFLSQSLSLKQALLESSTKDLNYQIKKSEYLPSFSVEAKYGYNDNEKIQGDDYYQYGLSFSLPLSYTSSHDIEQEKLEYLMTQQSYNKKKYEIQLEYENALVSIQNNQNKIVLAEEDIRLYKELINVNQEEYDAGYKTIDDIQSLKNSQKIREFDIKIYELNIKKVLIFVNLSLETN